MRGHRGLGPSRSLPSAPPGLGLSLSLLFHVLVSVLVLRLPASPPPRSPLEVFVADADPSSEPAAEPSSRTFLPPTQPSRPEPPRPRATVVSRPRVPLARPVEVPRPSSSPAQPAPATPPNASEPGLSSSSALSPTKAVVELPAVSSPSPKAEQPPDDPRRSEPPAIVTASPRPTAAIPANRIEPVSPASPAPSGSPATPLALNVPQTVTSSAERVATSERPGSASSQLPGPEIALRPDEPGQSEGKPLLTARTAPSRPPGTGAQEPLGLPTPAEPALPVLTKSDPNPLPAPSHSRLDPASPTPGVQRAAPGLVDDGATVDRPTRSGAAQPVAPELAISQIKPGPSDSRAGPTVGTSPGPRPDIGGTELPASTPSPAAGEPAWGAATRPKPDVRSSPVPVTSGAHRTLQPAAVPPASPSLADHEGAVGRPAGTTASRPAAPKADAPGLEPSQANRRAGLAVPTPTLPNRETTTDPRAGSDTPGGVESTQRSAEFAAGGSRLAEAPLAGVGPGRVEPAPNSAAIRIVITSPRDGLELAPEDPPIVVVEGEVDDVTVPTVWLVANDVRISAPVRSGRFRRAVVLTESTLRIHAEVPTTGGPTSRSATVAVHSTSITEFGIVLIDGSEAAGVPPQMHLTASWRSSPERLDDPQRTFPLRAVMGLDAGSMQAFYFRRPKPGVYTFVLGSRGAASALVPTIYLPRAGHLVRLGGNPIAALPSGPRLVGRVLLPYAVLWEQDDWFTGRSESADTMTKFRVPEGVTWIERKGGLR